MEKKKKFIIDIMYLVCIGVLFFFFFKYVFEPIIPFLIAFIVAYFIRYGVRRTGVKSEKIKKLVTVGFVLLFYSVIFTILTLVGVKMIDKLIGLIQSLPRLYNENIPPLLAQLSKLIEEVALKFDTNVAREVEKAFEEFQASLGKYITDFSFAAFSIISDGIMGIPSLIIKLIVTIVATFFMALDFDKITGLFRKVLGEKKYRVIYEGAWHTKKVIGAYLTSYTLLFLITFIELCIGMCLFQIPYPTVVALLIAVFDILPFLGTGGVLIPWALICLFTGNVPLGIGIFVLYIIITVVRNTLEPKVVGKQIGLHPLATLIAMFVGMRMFGLVGLIFFPVTLVVGVSMVKAGAIHFETEE